MINDQLLIKYHISPPEQSIEALKLLSNDFKVFSLKYIEDSIVPNNALPSIDLEHLEALMKTRFIDHTLVKHLKTPIYILTFDGCFNDGTNAKVYTNQGIILLAKPICSNAITEIFLHELGHMHHVMRTGDIETCPESFIRLLESDTVKSDDYLQTYWKRTAAKCHYDFTREKYADAYMIAAMSFISGTDVKRYITKHLRYNTTKLFQNYFLSNMV